MDLDYTTGTSDRKSIERICIMLQDSGATEVCQMGDGERVTAIEFVVHGVGPRWIRYRIAPDIDAVERVMMSNRRLADRYKHHGQYVRAAWLIVARWIDAQLLMVKSGQSTVNRLFASYEIGPVIDRSEPQTIAAGAIN